MCLCIKKDQYQNEKDLQNFIGDQEEILVYKILEKRDYEDFYRSLQYFNYTWDFKKQKTFEVNRDSIPTVEELKYGAIEEGLHVYIDLGKAQAKWGSSTQIVQKIVKFKVKKENIIAIENDLSWKDHNFKELVCTKLTFIEVIN
jgi:hypothetical protein